MMQIIERLFGRCPTHPGAKVEIYTWQTCPYCIRAKFLLWRKGVQYTEYKIDGDNLAREAMTQRAQGRRSVPQIFINGQHIGGCDDLYQLEKLGQLNPLLTETAPCT